MDETTNSRIGAVAVIDVTVGPGPVVGQFPLDIGYMCVEIVYFFYT